MAKAATIKKRRRQRGRPADEDCEREPNGRKRRSLRPAKPQDNPRMVAIEARVRQYGIPAEIAARGEAGTILGILWLQERINATEREAGELAAEWHGECLKAMEGPDSMATGGPGASGDFISDDYISWAIAATARWKVTKEWLLEKGAWDIFDRTVINRNYPTEIELVPLRIGLRYLAQRMGLDNAKS